MSLLPEPLRRGSASKRAVHDMHDCASMPRYKGLTSQGGDDDVSIADVSELSRPK